MKEAKWYIVQVKRNAYKRAEVNLVRQGFRCFQPLLKVTTREGGTFKDVAKPLFPGYLFVTFDPVTAHWHKISNSLCVARLSLKDGIPQAVPNGFVDDLKAKLDSTRHLVSFKDFVTGDNVYINSGPFVGLLAQVEHLKPNQRVSLLISLMGLETRLAADITDIKKI